MNPASDSAPAAKLFSPYQKQAVGMLAFLQFAVVLDFMIMSPLGAMIMPAMNISPTETREVRARMIIKTLGGIRIPSEPPAEMEPMAIFLL